MPDHLHMLVEGLRESSDCRAFIKHAKQLSGFYYKQQFGDRLWQRYSFEHVLRGEEATIGVARYIIENPVRAGFVVHAEDYALVGSDTYTVAQILDAIQMSGPPKGGHYVSALD
jgi:REP element-mobilizing transposase RayT